MTEFDLIGHTQKSIVLDASIVVPSGDDAAVVKVPKGFELVVTTDTMAQDTHFLVDTSAHAVGYKSVVISVSDIAAMGARPKWVTVALSMPDSNEAWYKSCSKGILDACKEYDLILIGGNLSKGPLTITSTVLGLVESGQSILQSTVKAGDDIYVSGYLGSGAAGLQNISEQCTQHLNYPCARVELGLALGGVATAMIDISDGLSQDLHRLCAKSGVGAEVDIDAIPHLPEVSLELALHGGDDYELCFTADPKHKGCIGELAEKINLPITKVGKILPNAEHFNIEVDGFKHF